MANQRIEKFSNEIEEIINELTDEEVTSLATTITGGLLKNKINSRQDALKAILNYSEDLPTLLRRKVFTRDKLLSYLHDKNVPIKFPVTKTEIMEKILQLWTNGCSEGQTNDTTEEIKPKNNLNDSPVGSSQSMRDETTPNRNNSQEIVTKTINDSGSDLHTQVNNEHENNDINVQNTVKLLAEQFSDWYYKLLNRDELSSDHFYPDAVLNLALTLNGDTTSTNVCNDPAAVTKTLIGVREQYNLFFNPNLMRDSLNAQMDSHGLVIIIVGGTLHINSVCVGVFEQMFALARDPFAENNWKIKRTDLRLKNGSNTDKPSSLGNAEEQVLDAPCREITK